MGSAATVSSSERIAAALLAADTSTVEHVRKMLAKVQSHPTEAKYRRLKTSSALFRERFVGSEDVLAVLGFVDEGELKVLPEAAAALVGDVDFLTGPSAMICLGQPARSGTGFVGLYQRLGE